MTSGVPADFQILDTSAAVIGGLVYGYIVFMVLPLYASLERMDGSLIEAGRDLYGSALQTFLMSPCPPPAGAYAGWRWSSCPPWATSSAPSCSAAPTT